MKTLNTQGLAKQYRDKLLNDVIPFWSRHSPDFEHGGYFTCLDRQGKVYNQDKFVWLQARQVWTYAMLYNRVEAKDEWLKMAALGANFLKQYGADPDGNFYFALSREGMALKHPFSIFSDCFAAMAFHAYAKASGEEYWKDIARRTYRNIKRRIPDPKGRFEKSTGNRKTKSLAIPMILSNLVLEMADVLEAEEVSSTLEVCVNEITQIFYDEKEGLMYEHMSIDNKHMDTFEGRLINPGHAIEASWFLMDIAGHYQDIALHEKAVKILQQMLKFGWDEDHEGIFYFLDAKGYPPDQLEWDRKLWWVHLETLIALTKAYRFQPDTELESWFKKVHQYAWSHFDDPEHGEWYGYLSREGQPFLSLKGGKWKGCFHMPRAMYLCWQALEDNFL